MRLLALVTARGGSKGFPGKNVAHLDGKPLVRWSYEALYEFRSKRSSIDIVLRLSTDNDVIAAAWPEPDRPTELRPARLAQDNTASIDVALYELDRQDQAGTPCDALLLVQPTSPLLICEDFEGMLQSYQLFRGAPQTVMGVTKCPHPVQWCMWRDGFIGVTTPILPMREETQRQDCQQAYLPVGVYMASAKFLREHRKFIIHGMTSTVVIPPERAIDIDYPIDLDFAETVLRRQRSFQQTACIS